MIGCLWFCLSGVVCVGFLVLIFVVGSFGEFLGRTVVGVTAVMMIAAGAISAVSVARALQTPVPQPPPARAVSTVTRVLCWALPLLVGLFGSVSTGVRFLSMNQPSAPSATVVELPAAADCILFLDERQPMAFNVTTADLLAWNPTEVKLAAELGPGDRFQCWTRLFSTGGRVWSIPAPIEKWIDLRISPDASRIAWEVLYDEPRDGVWIQDVSGAPAQRWGDGGWDPAFSPDGRDLYVCWGSLLLEGASRAQARTVYAAPETSRRVYRPAVSPDGQEVAFLLKEPADNTMRLCVVPRSGGPARELHVGLVAEVLSDPHWSPDGRQIAFLDQMPLRSEHPVRTLAVVDATGGPARRLMELDMGWLHPAGVVAFAWSPDGRQLAFVASLQGNTVLLNEGGALRHHHDLYTIGADGSGMTRRTRLRFVGGSVSPDTLVWIHRP